jgi:ribonucleoside-diphosphate reductase alpha chain
MSKGVRNGYVFAIAPNTSTSGRMAETASIYPVSDYIVEKEGKNGSIITPMPELQSLRWHYVPKVRVSPDGYLNTVEVFQKYVDQSISTELPYGSVLKTPKELHLFYVNGWKKNFKTMYYSRPKSAQCSVCAN